MIISPLISNLFFLKLSFNLIGIEDIVFKFFVILSPFDPSPLVNPLTSLPSSYNKLTDAPSYLSSQQNSKSVIPMFLTTLSYHASSSSEE